jgi:hypothetical protein
LHLAGLGTFLDRAREHEDPLAGQRIETSKERKERIRLEKQEAAAKHVEEELKNCAPPFFCKKKEKKKDCLFGLAFNKIGFFFGADWKFCLLVFLRGSSTRCSGARQRVQNFVCFPIGTRALSVRDFDCFILSLLKSIHLIDCLID